RIARRGADGAEKRRNRSANPAPRTPPVNSRLMAQHGFNAVDAVLTCHPETSPGGVSRIAVHIERRSNDALAVGFSLIGAITKICTPPAGEMRRADNLWQHTCFEVFLSVPE